VAKGGGVGWGGAGWGGVGGGGGKREGELYYELLENR